MRLLIGHSLLIIVIFSGYENFVSKLEDRRPRGPAGVVGKVDFGGLKLKLLASIVAISPPTC